MEPASNTDIGQHPDENAFAAWSDGRLCGPELQAMLAHLALCQRCRSVAKVQGAIGRPPAERVSTGFRSAQLKGRWPIVLVQSAAAILILSALSHFFLHFHGSVAPSDSIPNHISYSQARHRWNVSLEPYRGHASLAPPGDPFWAHVSLIRSQEEPGRELPAPLYLAKLTEGFDFEPIAVQHTGQIAIRTLKGERWITLSGSLGGHR